MISTIQLNSFLLYALCFRLAVVAAGMLSIVLGYRLFAKSSSGRGNANAEVTAAGFRVSLANAAPGTCFALFGVAVIVVMLWQGIPELQVSDKAMAGTPDVSVEVRALERSSMFVKGAAPGPEPAFEEQLQRAAALQQNDRRAEAEVEYFRALAAPNTSMSQGARALNEVAWMYHGSGRHSEALALARVCVAVDSGNEQFVDTLARAMIGNGNIEDALAATAEAVRRKPDNPLLLATRALALEAGGDDANALRVLEKAAQLDPELQPQLQRLRTKEGAPGAATPL